MVVVRMPPSTFIESSHVEREGLLVRGTGTSEAQALALPQALLAPGALGGAVGRCRVASCCRCDISEAAIVE